VCVGGSGTGTSICKRTSLVWVDAWALKYISGSINRNTKKCVYFWMIQRRLARHWGAGVIHAGSRRGYLKKFSRIELCMDDKGFRGRQYQKTTLALNPKRDYHSSSYSDELVVYLPPFFKGERKWQRMCTVRTCILYSYSYAPETWMYKVLYWQSTFPQLASACASLLWFMSRYANIEVFTWNHKEEIE